MEGEDSDTDNPRSFQKAAWWKRLIILVAGAFMNFVAGLLILCIIYAPSQAFLVPVIDQFQDYATIDDYGLQEGDRFVEIDGEKIYLTSDFSLILSLNDGDIHDIAVERDGELVVFDDFYLERHEVINKDGSKSMMLGFSFGIMEPNFGEKLEYVWYTAVDWVRTVRLSLQMLFSGEASISDVSGPVGIVDQMVDVATSSETAWDAVMNLLYFGAFIAVNLAIMNLLPIPALDGGRVVALLLTTGIEAITHKKIDPKYEGYIHAGGMILLLLLMAVILFKDAIFLFK
jgi:regulator of sigma E protease